MLLKELLRSLSLHDFIALDFETTGLDYEKDRIIEIGAVRWVDGVETDQFSTFVKPDAEISPQILKLTTIDLSKLKRAPRAGEVFPDLIEFLGDRPLVAQNIEFDLHFYLMTAKLTTGLTPYVPDNRLNDTLKISRMLLPTLGNHRLGTLARHLGVSLEGAHRAIHDARATGEILLRLLAIGAGLDPSLLKELAYIAGSEIEWAQRLIAGWQEFRQQGHQWPAIDVPESFAPLNVLEHEADGPDPTGERLEPLIEKVFSNDGGLSRILPGFTPRASQQNLARDIQRSFQEPFHLVAEAGAGTGKSHAYLIPSLLNARKSGERVLISTHTKNLQDQIFYKDLPDAMAALNIPGKVVLLKGRQNYICENRWSGYLDQLARRASAAEREAVLPLSVWMRHTRTGDINECRAFHHIHHPDIWQRIRSDGGFCGGELCRRERVCALNRVRKASQAADLVIINHSLLFADVQADNNVLGEYRHLVIDEAHNISRSAEQHLQLSFSFREWRNHLLSMYQKDGSERGTLVLLRDAVSFSDLSESQKSGFFARALELIEQMLNLSQQQDSLLKAQVERNKTEYGAEIQRRKFTIKKRFQRANHPLEFQMEAVESLLAEFRQFNNHLGSLLDDLEDAVPQKSPEMRTAVAENSAHLDAIRDLMQILDQVLDASDPGKVYWQEISPRWLETIFRICPLRIGEVIQESLFAPLEHLVALSATMTVAGKFDYFLNESGLDRIPEGKIQALDYGTPYDYSRQIRFLVPQYFADAGRQYPRFVKQVVSLLKEVAIPNELGTLVLFTSYRMLNDVYRQLIEEVDYKTTPILGQGLDGTSHDLLEKFRNAGNAILLGTESFWHGIDVPGKALELLVITKLPFAVPSEPMYEARMDMLKAAGENGFTKYAVPEAVIRFRQGFGRLIRSEQDRGIVILLDNRIIEKSYGSRFSQSVDTETRPVYQNELMQREVGDFVRRRIS